MCRIVHHVNSVAARTLAFWWRKREDAHGCTVDNFNGRLDLQRASCEDCELLIPVSYMLWQAPCLYVRNEAFHEIQQHEVNRFGLQNVARQLTLQAAPFRQSERLPLSEIEYKRQCLDRHALPALCARTRPFCHYLAWHDLPRFFIRKYRLLMSVQIWVLTVPRLASPRFLDLPFQVYVVDPDKPYPCR